MAKKVESNMKNLIRIFLVFLMLTTGILLAQNDTKDTGKKPKITFVELGSEKCIPCKQMQPVMASIEKRYGDQIKVIFYDVWKEEEEIYAEKYKIKLIPTQVFLNENGKEIHRHEGFYPEKEIDKFLQKNGLKPNKSK